eukprot:2428809-Prymnesium_polylepis.2
MASHSWQTPVARSPNRALQQQPLQHPAPAVRLEIRMAEQLDLLRHLGADPFGPGGPPQSA